MSEAKIVERMKHNLREWRYLHPDEQAVFERAGKENCRVQVPQYNWIRLGQEAAFFDDGIYQLLPDYQPPKPEPVELQKQAKEPEASRISVVRYTVVENCVVENDGGVGEILARCAKEPVAQKIADLLQEGRKMSEPEAAPIRGIVERIMTQHWDMAACKCWVCEEGRKAGCRPRDLYNSRDFGAVIVEKNPQ